MQGGFTCEKRLLLKQPPVSRQIKHICFTRRYARTAPHSYVHFFSFFCFTSFDLFSDNPSSWLQIFKLIPCFFLAGHFSVCSHAAKAAAASCRVSALWLGVCCSSWSGPFWRLPSNRVTSEITVADPAGHVCGIWLLCITPALGEIIQLITQTCNSIKTYILSYLCCHNSTFFVILCRVLMKQFSCLLY